MTMSEQQSAKNIDPKAREIAKDLARRSGMTLGEWLTQMIVDGDAGSNFAGGQSGSGQDDQRQPTRHVEDSEELHAPAPSALFSRQPGESYYWRKPENPRANYVDPGYTDRYYAQGGRAEPGAGYEDDLARITRALERMSGRIEAAEQRSTLAVTGIDQSVMGLLSRLETTERNQTSVVARVEGDLDTIRTSQSQIAERLKRMEEEGERGGRNFDALRSLETALSKLASHLYENEAKSKDSIAAIEAGLNSLSGRVDEKINALVAQIESTIRDTSSEARASSVDVEVAVSRIAERLEQSEAATGAALKALENRQDTALKTMEERQGEALKAFEERQNAIVPPIVDVDGAVSKITERLEQTETMTNSALNRITDRLEQSEGVTNTALGRITERLEQSEGVTNTALGRITERLEQTESVTNTALGRITERLEQAEGATNSALNSLQTSIAGLEERIRMAEAKGGDADAEALTAFEERFTRLSKDLNDMVSETRSQLVQKIEEAAANTDLGRVDAAITTLNRHIEEAETRSAGAIDRLADEVARIAGAVDKRISMVEGQSATAIETISNEVGKIADALDTKFRASEGKNIEAIERLGAEFARISDRLTERLVSAERRSSVALDQVGEEVGKISERLTQRYERAAADLAERLRASEQRTQGMIEETQNRVGQHIDQKFAEADRRTLDTIAPVNRTMAELATRLDTLDGRTTVLASAVSRPVEPTFYEPPAAQPLNIKSSGRYELPVTAAFSTEAHVDVEPHGEYEGGAVDDLIAAETYEPEAVAVSDTVTPFPTASFHTIPAPEQIVLADVTEDFAPAEESHVFAEPDQTVSAFDAVLDDTAAIEPGMADLIPSAPVEAAAADALPIGATAGRDFLDQARRAMRVVGVPEKEKPAKKAKKGKSSVEDKALYTSAAFATHVETPLRSSAFDTLPPLNKKDGKGGKSASVLVGAGLAVAAVGAAAYMAKSGDLDEALKRLGVEIPNASSLATNGIATATDMSVDAATGDTVLTVTPTTKAGKDVTSKSKAEDALMAAPATAATDTLNSVSPASNVAQYQSGLKLIAAGDAKAGAALVKKAAEAGLPDAQYKLATLYEGGKGVKESMPEAFRWTERAAQAGNRKAMHNMGLYYYYGDGTAQSYDKAAIWFRQAAERGSADSQYNLALLHEEGFGVKKDPVEAYKWFSVAAKSGDAQARKKADALAAQMTPDMLKVASAASASFKPLPVDAHANGQFEGRGPSANLMYRQH